jgi:hypothetical protein
LTVLLCAISVALAAPAAHARRQDTARIDGTARAASGGTLPGATVTLTGAGSPMVQVTDAEGRFRFRGLSAGTYTVEIKADGFQTVTTAVRVATNARPTVTFELTPSTDDSVIVVRGDSPFQTAQRLSWTAWDLEKIPTARDPWAVLQQTPGVLTDRINVGGNESGQQSVYVGPGAPAPGGLWYLDGTIVTDMGAVGSSPAYYDFDTFEELQVTTGGADTSIATGGVVLNMVTKSGTNQFDGMVSFYERAGDIDGDRPSRNAGFDGGRDFGAALGGPFWRDRVWFFGSYGRSSANVVRTAGDVPVDADVDSDRLTGKLLLSPGSGHSLSGSYLQFDTETAGAGAGFGRNASSTSERQHDLGVFTARYNGSLSNSLFLELSAGRSAIDASEVPNAGVPTFGGGAWSNSYLDFTSERPSSEYRASLEYLVDTSWGSHEFKTGMERRDYSEESSAAWASNGFTLVDGQFPIRVLTPINNWSLEGSRTSLFVQDTLAVGNLTANLGIRYDSESAANRASQLGANPDAPEAVPGGRYPGGDVFEWSQVSPRLGLTYALGEDRQTLLRASYSRFADQLGTGSASFENPLFGIPGTSYTYFFSFDDRNGNGLRDADEARSAGSRLGPAGDSPDAFSDPTRVSDDLAAPKVDEWVAGFSQAFGDWLLGADVIGRRSTGLVQDLPLVSSGGASRVAAFDDYVADPLGDPFGIDAWRLRQGLAQTGFERRNGDREQEYLGASLYFTKRLANRWMLRGHYTWSDWTTSVPDSTLGDPNDLVGTDDNDGAPVAYEGGPGRSGLFINSGWSFDVSGLYRIVPDRPWGVDVGWNFNGREGYLSPTFATLRGGDNVTRRLQSDEAERRLPDLYQLNLRVGTDFAIGRSRLGLSVEVANVTGTDTVLQEDRDLTSTSFGTVTERLGGRAIRIGGVIRVR